MLPITVSVFILTYNQENFISQTLDSILDQKTDFNFQLVIGEDCSTDATRVTCEKYAEKYPQRVKLLPALDHNIGLIKNYIRTIKECDGKYIAICDGDDYWIDDHKLQKQVEFLENNSEFSIVYTKVRKVFSDGKYKEWTANPKKIDTDFDDLIFDNYIPSVTVLFKNNQNISDLPAWVVKFPYGDWPTYLWTIKDGGRIHFLNEETSVYRMNIGISTKLRTQISDVIKVNTAITEEIFNDTNFSHKRGIVKKALIQKRINLMVCYNRERNYIKAFKLYAKNLKDHLKGYRITKIYLYSIYKSI